MATSMSMASPANHTALLAALLCGAIAASFLPGSSAANAPLLSQTCRRTSNQRLCVSMLQSSNRSLAATTTVRELAVVAVTAARRSVLSARLRASIMGHEARGTPAERPVERCEALYSDCLRAATTALATVSTMTAYEDRAADAVSALRVFPEKCGSLFRGKEVASPLEKVSRKVEEELGVAAEIVRLLR